MRKSSSNLIALLACILISTATYAQTVITGNVRNSQTSEFVPSASVTIKGSTTGTVSDSRGNFKLTTSQAPPFTLVVSSVGFETREIQVTDASAPVQVDFNPSSMLGTEVVVSASRVPQRILESPVSIEKMNAATIRQLPVPNFYDALPSLKGVESSVQSLTFRGITTRGFNSNGNTRFNQFIDGMDNQAPGLNFSVANIVGISELDLQNLELLPGASSALYGAGGMNGTLLMTSKSPFDYQGLSVKLQAGVNHIGTVQQPNVGFVPDVMLRYAKAFGRFAFKVNFAYMQADDWRAQDSSNFDRLTNSVKPGFSHHDDPNYDGVNVYGDEINHTYRGIPAPLNNVTVSRTGYREEDLVDYNTKSLKAGLALHYKITDNIEAIAQGNYGSGTTVYTGSDRYSLRNFNIGQYKLELRGRNFFLRGYTTQERSGEAYNATALGTILNEAYNPSTTWFTEYAGAFYTALGGGKTVAQAHDAARAYADRNRLMPGTPQFNQAKDAITSAYIGYGPGRNGAKFNDKSNLYHYEGMYDFSQHIKIFELQAGASYRRYVLNSNGTIFDDANGSIKVDEYGAFVQAGKRLFDRLKLTASVRYDKNQNFDGRFTPRVAAVFTVAPNNFIRASFQTGYRNPTNQDQYIDLPIRANTRLIGGLPQIINDKYHLDTNPGYTLESVQKYLTTGNPADLVVYHFGKFKPETVSGAFEVGYKGLINNRLMIDASYYYQAYKDFLSYLVVIQNLGTPNQANYATYVNNPKAVTTQGWALGLDYVMRTWNVFGNVSYNSIQEPNSALSSTFNSPNYRFNIGFANKKVYDNIGFNIMYRWQNSFFWNSSFAAGNVPAFGTIDAQINYRLPKAKTMIKLGGSNVLNHYYQTSFGNPKIGAIYYVAIVFDEMMK
ncbi:MAG: TonB-dependent receptor [Bacteroidetes bacterium]|nr:MAG: TonB-dependent receptor [Bacteroidota bacterium]